ncbi:ParB N-terminal domain-containing protein [bacterium]|nr:ParB N-terminal domain-containing protein [bacterium]
MKKRKKYSIDEINPKLIAIDPSNVRDESEEEIKSDEDFQRLKDSIYEFGVLVPLVVKPYLKEGKEFILIDGERRLRAALETNQQKVPVHKVTKPETGDEVLYAFQIHTLRKEWSRTAQARALKSIVKNVQQELGQKQEEQILDIIQEKTGYSDTKLRDLFRVLKYADKDEKILEEIDDPKNNIRFSHLVQLEASFVEQIERLFPDIIKKYGIDTIREKLLDKVRKKVISTTREPIDNLLPLFMQAKTSEQKEELKKLIIEFLDKKNKTPGDIYRSFELKFPLNKEDLIKLAGEAEEKIEELESIIGNLRFSQLKIYPNLKENLFKKIDSLIDILRQAKKKVR